MIPQQEASNFPSHFVAPEIKKEKDWCMKWAEAIHRMDGRGETSPVFHRKRSDYFEWRALARGEQNPDQYKNLLGSKRNNGRGKPNLSYRNLNWDILPIAPRFVKLLIGKLVKDGGSINVKGIDQISVSQEKKKQYELLEFATNQALYKAVSETTGIGFQEPDTSGLPLPEDRNQLAALSGMLFKDRLAMEFKDIVDFNFAANDMPQLEEELCQDLIEVGVAGTKTYNDAVGFTKIRRVSVENLVVNNCRHKDFRDAYLFGEYIYCTIADIKQMWPGQKEEVYRDIANKATKKGYRYEGDYDAYYKKNYSYPYDDQEIVLLNCEWKSNDSIVQVEKKSKWGNTRVYDKAPNYQPGEADSDRRVIRKDITNWYKCTWVVGTEYAFDFGMVTNMIRQSSNYADAKSNFQLYTTDNDSLIRQIAPILHSIQLNWLQFQHHVAKSKPSGLAIERTSFQEITLGKGGEKISPKEMLQMYLELGTYIWSKKEWSGKDNTNRPIEELKGGMSEAAMQHFGLILQHIDLLRQILGIPQVEAAISQNPEIGKGVSQMAMGSALDAMNYLFHAKKSILERTAGNVGILVQDSIKYYGGRTYENALGMETVKFVQMVKDMELRDFAVFYEYGPDAEKKQLIASIVQRGLDEKSIDAEDALLITDEIKNPQKALALLRQIRKKKVDEQQAREMQLLKQQEQVQINSAQAASQAKAQELQIEAESKMKQEALMSQLRRQEQAEKYQYELLLRKMDNNIELTTNEQELMNKLMVARVQGEYMLEGKRLDAKNKPKPVSK